MRFDPLVADPASPSAGAYCGRVNIPHASSVPADSTSRDRLAARGLDYRVIEGDALADHLRAEHRGFLDDEPTDETIADELLLMQPGRRVIGVYDPEAAQPFPVATECSWGAPLTVPGGEVPMWAISGVTVAATHRRRGIARGMLEGELRAAADAGFAIAGLTVTEATIYGRYGFAPAAPAARIRIDTHRAGWGGYEPAARVFFVEREHLAADLDALHERTRLDRVGDTAAWPRHWRSVAGLVPEADKPRRIRGVRAVDASGELVGSMAFEILTSDERATLRVGHLVAATADARAALWRFVIAYDLVDTVEARLQPADDPLPWQVRDRRAVERKVRDHEWLRILDVPAALKSRSLSGAFGVRIEVTDPLGIANGAFTVAQFGAEGVQVESLPDGERPEITLDVGALSAAYLGGVPLETLEAAGRVTGSADKIRAFSDALRTTRAPHLSFVY